MHTRDVIKKIIDAGIQAPSGENCQPWKFFVQGNTMHLYNIPERDVSFCNFGQSGSFVAHGALLENMVVAKALGFEAKTTLFPDKKINILSPRLR